MRFRYLLALALCFCSGWSSAPVSAEVTDQEIQTAIRKARAYLHGELRERGKGNALTAYALLKTGTSEDDAKIQKVLAHLETYFSSGEFKGGQDHYYSAGVVAMIYDTLGGEKHKDKLEAIARYIMDGQHENGAWYYPTHTVDQDVGDTSISQYALLGLWAAQRAEIEIPKKVWNDAARWYISTQRAEGGFVYHPGDRGVHGSEVRPSLVAAGGSSLSLCLRMLYPHGAIFERRVQQQKKKNAHPPKTYGGLLEIIDVTVEENEQPEVKNEPGLVPASTLKTRSERSLKILASLPKLGMEFQQWRSYYLYGLERFAAFIESDTIDDRDWYQEGAEFLVASQNADGSWSEPRPDTISTCFCVLFLYKATAKTVRPRRPPEAQIGSGLLAGGRGLPSDLRTVQKKNGKIVSETPDLPVTDLLTQLESSAAADLVPLQKAVIETVQKGQRQELVGQTDRLLKLLKSPDPEVRQIAVWSLARGNDITLAPVLIHLIRKDPHFDVALEAYSGLCVLSRKLDGVGLSKNPLKKARAEQAREESGLETKARQWRAEAAKRWEEWYLTVRPYQERDDLQDLKE